MSITNTCLSHGRISGFYVQVKRYRQVSNMSMNLGGFRLHNFLTRLEIIMQLFQNPKSARMPTSNPGAQRLIFLIGIGITMTAFGLMMELQKLKTSGDSKIIHGLLILSTMLTGTTLWRKTITVAQSWVTS
ncbi:hypothetical protein PITC_049310 [Penicillium italicum]|uniref:Uncharacterized protein n=1 Tax=Penicillium italicum TaxID=40296 RepID=A0A0A2K6T5_PENIT|nr:hypothetical protein PITC_049310 [Penicillium italicum]